MPRIVIREERCKGCGLCREACPKKILSPDPGYNEKGYHPMRCVEPDKCIGCAMCAMSCPDVVIEVYK